MADGQPRVVKLDGEYDAFRRDELQDALDVINGSTVIDLTQVTYCDSLFLGELIRLKRRLPGATLTLAGASTNIKRVLLIVGFDRLFHIVDSLDAPP